MITVAGKGERQAENLVLVLQALLANGASLLLFYGPKQVIWPHLISNKHGQGKGRVRLRGGVQRVQPYHVPSKNRICEHSLMTTMSPP